MQFTAEHHLDGIVEREFRVGPIPGMLWTPSSATHSAPAPLILAGQPAGPAGLNRTHPRLVARARRAAESGFATATIELPGSGERPLPDGVEQARAEMREALTTGMRVADETVDRLVLPLVEKAVPEWQATLDALLDLPEIGDRVGYSGGVISIAVRLALVEPRLAAAVLFAGSYVPRSIIEDARHIEIPLYVLLQWDDEVNDRQVALELFDAFGSREKTLNANMGGHTGVPEHAGDEAIRFFARHVR
jgi:dienelactone hydrolase